MNVISKQEARDRGLTRYFTGRPCRKNHISERFLNGNCCECDRTNCKKYYCNNSDEIKAKQNLRDIKAYNRKYYLDNPDKNLFRKSKRRACKLKATPLWADHKLIQSFYTESARISKETGIIHHVDHIVPLQNELVCGLHNQFNLQVITATENIAKGNRFWPDMPD